MTEQLNDMWNVVISLNTQKMLQSLVGGKIIFKILPTALDFESAERLDKLNLPWNLENSGSVSRYTCSPLSLTPCSILMSHTPHTSCPDPVVTNVPPRSWSRPSTNQTRALTAATPSTREAPVPRRCSWMSTVSVDGGLLVFLCINGCNATTNHCQARKKPLKRNHWLQYSLVQLHFLGLMVSHLHSMQIGK